MTSQHDGIRRTIDRANRLAAGDTRSHTERVSDALAGLMDVIYQERDPALRLQAFGTALAYIRSRTRAEYIEVTGEEP